MDHDWKVSVKKGFAFSNEMIASATHDVKNSLAVIKESAGLLEDLVHLADRGTPLKPEKIISVCQRITKHVNDATATIANVNRLSHSTDSFKASVNLAEILSFLTVIGARITSSKGIKIEIIENGESPVLETSPFFLKQLVWQCLGCITGSSGNGSKICLEVSGEPGRASIIFKGAVVSEDEFKRFKAETESALGPLIQFNLSQDQPSGNMILALGDALKSIPETSG